MIMVEEFFLGILMDHFSLDPMKHSADHNLPFTVLGTGFLWIAWNGYNAGASLASDGKLFEKFAQ